MYYEETILNNKLMYRTIPNGVWYEVSNETLTKRLHDAETEVRQLKAFYL